MIKSILRLVILIKLVAFIQEQLDQSEIMIETVRKQITQLDQQRADLIAYSNKIVYTKRMLNQVMKILKRV